MKNSILILGTRMDPHVDRIAGMLESRADTVVRVLDFKKASDVSVHVDQAGQARFVVDGEPLPPHTLIWDRVKLLAGTKMYPDGDERGSGFAAREWRALYNLFGMFFDGQVINPPQSKRAMLKPLQQARAAKAGFLVPPTLISNRKADLQAFCEDAPDGTILKSLSGGKIKPQGEGEYIPYNIMTMRIAGDDVAAAEAGEFSVCPHFFQHEIRKSFELRIVVVADYVKAFAINSQEYACSTLDWRNGIPILKFEPHVLARADEDKIRRFMQAMGFVFGSIDVIVDTEGRYWFLECNEDGQWAWLDDIVEGEIARTFTGELVRRAARLAETVGEPA